MRWLLLCFFMGLCVRVVYFGDLCFFELMCVVIVCLLGHSWGDVGGRFGRS